MSINTITFSARQNPKLTPITLQKEMTNKRVQRIILNIFTLGIYELCSLMARGLKKKLIPLYYMPAIKAPCYPRSPDSLRIETLDGVQLDAHEKLNHLNSPKWMVFFCPNGARYEEVMAEKTAIAYRLGANVLFFNYRNVGHSQGILQYGRELLLDGSAIIEYLKQKKGIKESDLILYGHSMGGGVATALTNHYTQVKLISDRPYDQLSHVIPLLAPFVKALGLDINAINAWNKLPNAQKMIVYHRKDGVIPYAKASLYYAAKKHLKQKHPKGCVSKITSSKQGLMDDLKPLRVKAQQESHDGKAAHCYPLRGDEYEDFHRKAHHLIWSIPENSPS